MWRCCLVLICSLQLFSFGICGTIAGFLTESPQSIPALSAVSLDDVVFGTAEMDGSHIGSGPVVGLNCLYSAAGVYSTTDRTYIYYTYNVGFVKSVLVKFTITGSSVYATALTAQYTSGDSTTSCSAVNAALATPTASTIATCASCTGYGVFNLLAYGTSMTPTETPSAMPTGSPSAAPTTPTVTPTATPSATPSAMPSMAPTSSITFTYTPYVTETPVAIPQLSGATNLAAITFGAGHISGTGGEFTATSCLHSISSTQLVYIFLASTTHEAPRSAMVAIQLTFGVGDAVEISSFRVPALPQGHYEGDCPGAVVAYDTNEDPSSLATCNVCEGFGLDEIVITYTPGEPSPAPSATPTATPSAVPTMPTVTPSAPPSATPSAAPSMAPTSFITFAYAPYVTETPVAIPQLSGATNLAAITFGTAHIGGGADFTAYACPYSLSSTQAVYIFLASTTHESPLSAVVAVKLTFGDGGGGGGVGVEISSFQVPVYARGHYENDCPGAILAFDAADDFVALATCDGCNGFGLEDIMITYTPGEPSPAPSATPTVVPSAAPTVTPSAVPTAVPSYSQAPTHAPNLATGPRPNIPDRYKIRNIFSFVAVNAGGQVLTWGASSAGGDSARVAAHLQNVSSVTSGRNAFAALTRTGGVVAWGSGSSTNGHATTLAERTDIISLYATESAFAALTEDRAVLTIGSSSGGGNAARDGVAPRLSSGVKSVVASSAAFAALKHDGTVYAWGNSFSGGGGESSETFHELRNITALYSAMAAFAALREDGRVVTWGGGVTRGLVPDAVNISQIASNRGAFAAIQRETGRVTAWGVTHAGGDASSVAGALWAGGVTYVAATDSAFAALTAEGRVITWGDGTTGGDSTSVASQLRNVTQIFSNSRAFLSLSVDGRVVAWGDRRAGGELWVNVTSELSANVTAVFHTKQAFAVLKLDHSLVVWGNPRYGGHVPTALQEYLSAGQVRTVCACDVAFTALLWDGSAVRWGNGNAVTPGRVTDVDYSNMACV